LSIQKRRSFSACPKRERDGEDELSARAFFGPYGSAMPFHDLAADGQPQPCGGRGRTGLFHAVETVEDALHILLRDARPLVAYGKDGIFYRPDSAHMAFFNNYNASVRKEIRAPLIPLNEKDLSDTPEKLTKILVYEPADDLIQELSAKKALEVTSSMHSVIDIMPEGSTKGNAVVALASYLHVPMENVFCFGDGDNDISMFTCGAVGVAMGNASEKAKSFASIITRNCKDDGVAYAIRHLI